MSVETIAIDNDRVAAELELYEQELINPALGELVLTAAQIRVNPHAEVYIGEGRMRDQAGDAYECPQVCQAYNNLDPETQRVVTTRMLNGLSPDTDDGKQSYAYDVVNTLLDATMRDAGKGRITMAFEDEWRERAWEVLWADEDYQKVRTDAQDALSEESGRHATRARNLTALNIMAAISAGMYYRAPKAE